MDRASFASTVSKGLEEMKDALTGAYVGILILSLIVGFLFTRASGFIAGFGWFIVVCSGLGLIGSLLSIGDAEQKKEETERLKTLKQCPYCAEDIKIEARKCKHCGEAVA